MKYFLPLGYSMINSVARWSSWLLCYCVDLCIFQQLLWFSNKSLVLRKWIHKVDSYYRIAAKELAHSVVGIIIFTNMARLLISCQNETDCVPGPFL